MEDYEEEIRNVLEEKKEMSHPVSEKPLSPVLSYRKIMHTKKIVRRNPRKKLLNKFDSEEPKKQEDINEVFSEDSFTLSQTDSMLDTLERLEEIEKNREKMYKIIVSSRDDKFCFKKPLSPAPSRVKRFKSAHINHESIQEEMPQEEIIENIDKEMLISSNDIPIPTDVSFSTGGGKIITINEDVARKHSDIFKDIFNPFEKFRGRKFNFLSKTQNNSSDYSATEHNGNSVSLKTDNDSLENCGTSEPFEDTILEKIPGKNEAKIKNVNILKQIFEEDIFDKSISENKTLAKDSCAEQKLVSDIPEFAEKIFAGIIDAGDSNPCFNANKQFESLSNFNGEIGFKKASGKCIALSENAILRAQAMFEEKEENSINDKKVCFPHNTDLKLDTKTSHSSENIEKPLSVKESDSETLNKPVAESEVCIKSDLKGNKPMYKSVNNVPLERDNVYNLSHKNNTINKKYNSNFCSSTKTIDKARNIFETENFDDLFGSSSKDCGLKTPRILNAFNVKRITKNLEPSSLKSKDLSDTNILPVNTLSSKAFTISGKPLNTIKNKNIFEEENFDDLFGSSSKDCGFRKPTISNAFNVPKKNSEPFSSNPNIFPMNKLSSKSCTISGKPLNTIKNIFDGENFDDLFGASSSSKSLGFQQPITHLKSGNFKLSFNAPLKNYTLNRLPKNVLSKGKNIFDCENFDDLAVCTNKSEFQLLDKRPNSIQISSETTNSELGFTKDEINISREVTANVEDCLKYLTQLLQNVKGKRVQDSENISEKLNEQISKRTKAKAFISKFSNEFSIKETDIIPHPISFNSSNPCKNNLTRRSLFSASSNCSSPEDGYKLNAKRSIKKRLGVVSSCKPIPVSEATLEGAKNFFERELLKTNHSTPTRNVFVPKFSSTPLENSPINFKEDITITPIKNEQTLSEGSKTYLDETVVPQKFCFKSPKDINIDEQIEEFSNEKKILEDQLKSVIERLELLKKNKELIVDNQNIRPTEGILYKKKKQKCRLKLKDFVNEFHKECNTTSLLFKINPHNAENFHFNFHESISSIRTEDNAEVILNLNKQIGLSEIEHAFKIMPGVDTKLIPNRWIRNHYKWVVWKLASFERMFPNKFEDCLCVENIIQQLKYRYDREIDKAERPIVRKILEKDIASQRRMILCVSNITKNNNSYELELTDGWYSIRTIIDEPLTQQLVNRKLQTGTKLVTHGAELLNCDGCHPLEATDLTRLKISYNSTRRATWDAKLGHQMHCGPFPISIESVHPNGGVIGRVDVYVARVYPPKFMEKRGNVTIWRNRRAENKARNEFENNRLKKYDEIREKLQEEYLGKSCSNSGTEASDMSTNDSKFEIYAKLEERMKEELPMQNFSTSFNKVTVVDVLGASDKGYNLNLWRQDEIYENIFKEGEILTITNILPSKNGELCANMSTKYIRKPKDPSKSEKYQRRVTAIALLLEFNHNPLFGEFDTIGFVIQIDVGPIQEIWMADHQGRLLLIKINESPDTIALPDYKIKEIKSVCNLVLMRSCGLSGVAMANHYTIFSKYPAHKHLREALEQFEKQIPEDFDAFWKECKNNIEKIKRKERSKTNSTFSEDDINCSQITETDRALSLIDFDKFT